MFNQAQELIFERYKNPLFRGSLEKANFLAEGENPLCGDEVSFTAEVHEGTIQTIRHQGRACAICTAAADLLAERLENQPFTAIKEIKNEEVIEELGIPLTPVRIKCALLPLEAARQGRLQVKKD